MAVITGTFNSLVSGTITGVFQNTAGGVLSGVIGTPGPAGATGATGPQGDPGEPGQGVPAGGLASQVLAKIDGQDFNTEWVDQSGAVVWGDIGGEISNQGDLVSALADKLDVTTAAATYYLQTNPNGFITVSALTGYATQSWVTAGFYPLSGNPSGFLTASALTPYLSKAGNLSGLTSLSTARDNLNLGTSNTPVFAGLTAQGSAGNIAQLTPTSLTLTQAGSGIFTIQPSQGIVFPDATVQTTAYPGPVGATQWGSIGGSLINQTDLYNSLAAKLDSTTAASTYAVIAAGQPASGTVGQVLTKNSGTNYDSSWATLIPGDRYLTSSTTSLTIDNANKTLTVGTGLSYTPQQDVVIAYDASNHMHAQVLTYNSGTGVMTVDVQSHTGTGTFAAWTVNVGGTVPVASIVWGDILGTLGNQGDLATALSNKLETTTAASTYFTIASAAGKANLAGDTFTGKVNLASIGVANPSINLGGQCDPAPASAANGDLWISNAVSPKLTYKMGGVNYNLPVLNQFNTFTGQMVIDTSSSSVAALRVTQRGAGNAIEVEDSTTPDANKFVVDQFGKVGIGVAPDATAALKVDTNGIMFGDGTTQTTAAAGGGGSGADIQTFTTAGTATWTKPAGKTMAWIRVFSGGCGGGSGCRTSIASGRSGGGGGAGGAVIEAIVPISSLGATETVTVGAGGAGGAAVTADNIDGSQGSSGGLSSFSNFRAVLGTVTGLGGGGTATGGAAGTAAAQFAFINGLSISTNTNIHGGGVGTLTTGATGFGSAAYYVAPTGGGGGAGAGGTLIVTANGGPGGPKNPGTATSRFSSLINAVAGGTGGNQTTPTLPTVGTSGVATYQGGTGGGGGSYKTATAGQAGAAGAQPGGGGGGGAASDNGFTSGAGGAGGAGMVIVVCY